MFDYAEATAPEGLSVLVTDEADWDAMTRAATAIAAHDYADRMVGKVLHRVRLDATTVEVIVEDLGPRR